MIKRNCFQKGGRNLLLRQIIIYDQKRRKVWSYRFRIWFHQSAKRVSMSALPSTSFSCNSASILKALAAWRA